MSIPSDLDTAIQTLITSGTGTSIPVAKSSFVPSFDMKETPNGYVFWDLSDIEPYHSSEGFSEANGHEVCNFTLDVACVAYSNSQRKSIVTSVLSVLQPIVSGRRTQLTSYDVGTTGVFMNYLRLDSMNETTTIKTGQSNPDMSMLVLSFTGKATC